MLFRSLFPSHDTPLFDLKTSINSSNSFIIPASFFNSASFHLNNVSPIGVKLVSVTEFTSAPFSINILANEITPVKQANPNGVKFSCVSSISSICGSFLLKMSLNIVSFKTSLSGFEELTYALAIV